MTVSKHRVYLGNISWLCFKLCDRYTTLRALILLSSQYTTIKIMLLRAHFMYRLCHDSRVQLPQQLQNIGPVGLAEVQEQKGLLLWFLTSFLKNVFLCGLRHHKLRTARKIWLSHFLFLHSESSKVCVCVCVCMRALAFALMCEPKKISSTILKHGQ
jgi:hypothetical protein